MVFRASSVNVGLGEARPSNVYIPQKKYKYTLM